MLLTFISVILMVTQAVFAATTTDIASASNPSKPNVTAQSDVVSFLQTLQAAQVASMPCLITLVNMTQTSIGTCLGISDLATLLVPSGAGGANTSASFSDGLDSYLSGVCKGAGCSEYEIAEARGQLDSNCQGQTGGGLVPAIQAILASYTSSYKTLGCSIYFNGTANNCVTETISGSRTANSPQFFMDLISGQNLQQYVNDVFKSAQCTGCMHELYKAAVFLIPNIRSQSITTDMGNHLKNDCGSGPDPNWPTVMDQSMPKALTVEQNKDTGTGRKSAAVGVTGGAGFEEVFKAAMVVLAGMGAGWLVVEK